MPPLDPNILLGARGISLPDPLETAKQGLSLADLSTASQVRQYALKSAQKQDEASAALGQILPGLMQANWSQESMAQAMQHPAVQAHPEIASALLDTFDKRQKAMLEADKTRAETAKSSAAAKIDLLKPITNQAYSLANDPNLTPEKIRGLMNNISSNGLEHLVQNIPFQSWTDIATARQGLKTIGSAFFEAEKQVSTAETGRHNIIEEKRQAENTASEIARRAAETSIGWANVNKPTIQATDEGLFSVDPRKGTGTPILGPDKEPLVKAGSGKLSQPQSTATAFAMRMRDARTVIDQLEADGSVDPTGVLVAQAGKTGWVGTPENVAIGKMNPQAQVYEQAKRNWVTANLRKESGAAIPPEEMDQDMRKWFPVVGDKQPVIDAKRAAREVAEKAMIVEAGPGSKNIPDVVPPKKSVPPPKLGEVRKGFRYKGGDPGVETNWEPTTSAR